MITKKTDFLRLEIGGTLVTYGDRSPAHVHCSPLLDVRHLADVGDGAENAGEQRAGRVTRLLAVQVALQQSREHLLKRF